MLAPFHLFFSVDFRLHIKNEYPIRFNRFRLTANYRRFYDNLYTQILMLVKPMALSSRQKFSNFVQTNLLRFEYDNPV